MFELLAANNDPTPPAWRSKLPFLEQNAPVTGRNDVSDAIQFFRGLANIPNPGSPLNPPVNLDQARARGWLAYCYISVANDGWTIEDWDRSHGGAVPDFGTVQALRAEATRICDHLWGIAALRTDYDIRWARAFERLYSNDPDSTVTILQSLGKEPPDDDAGLFAEAADMVVYLGYPRAAIRLARTAIGITQVAGDPIPDWYYWTLAWAEYSFAVIEPDINIKRDRLKKSRATLQQMRRSATSRRFDFDSTLLLAAIAKGIYDIRTSAADDGEAEDRDQARDYFQARVQQKKLNKLWTATLEMERSPFDHRDQVSNPNGYALWQNWQAVSSALLPP